MARESFPPHVTAFLALFEESTPIFYREVERTIAGRPDLFVELADPMLRWAEIQLGEGYADILIEGYCTFVLDVNRSQLLYEGERRYEHNSYREVYEKTYDSAEFMN